MKDVEKVYERIWDENIPQEDVRKAMKLLFKEYFYEYSHLWVKIDLTPEEVEAADLFTIKKCKAKTIESIYQKDGAKMVDRGKTGSYAEFAVQRYLRELLGMPDFVDTRIGHSKTFDVPDIPALNMGIKAGEWFKVPAVPIVGRNSYPQVICIVDKINPSKPTVYICGIADPDVIDTYQNESMILDDAFRSRHVKAGFYGFGHLKPIDSLLSETSLRMNIKTRIQRKS